MQEHIGKRFKGYQIVEQIGRGGMATVYKAYQPSMDRYVAIKILPRHFTEDESFMRRFTQEARTLARLEHPHILPVHDYGEQEGVTYLIMRYVEAGTLKDLITREGPMELKDAARVLGQVGRALDYAHSHEVIHRDIKSSNILIDERGNVFLTDFGIAKLVAETAQLTASGAIIGTPAYMSPEQGMGKPVDYRCDIYSLGVVLYELVTGRVPFEAETPLAVLLKHVTDPLPLPRQIKPDLPPAVERVILKAMAKAPEDRFQSAREMVDALAAAVAAVPTEITSRPPAGAGEVATLIRDKKPPPPAADVTPPPAAEAMPPPVADATPPRLEARTPARKSLPWLPIAGAVAVLAVLIVAAVLILPNLGGETEATPTAVATLAKATSGGTSVAVATLAQATSGAVATAGASPGAAQPSPTVQPPPTAVPATVTPDLSRYPPGWTNYSNGNFVSTLARLEDSLLAGGESGLVVWDLTDGSYEKGGRADGLASNCINDLLVDNEGVLWIATSAGINRLGAEDETLITYDEADGLDASWIQTLFLDWNGRLWAGSHGGERGLNYYDGEGWGPPPIPPLPVDQPSIRVLDGNEELGLFVGIENQGLARFDGQEWITSTSADGELPSDGVLDMLLTADALWVSLDEALVRFDMGTGDPETIPQPDIHTIHQTADGKLWFGGEWRALRYDPARGDWQEFWTGPDGPIPGWIVTDIVEDGDVLWFGTYGGGVAFYGGGRWETWAIDAEVGGNNIQAIRQDKEGAIWFTHEGTGLSRYEPEGDVWQVFGEAEGALDWPGALAVDNDGNLWIGESSELLWYDGRGWQRFTAPELTDVGIYEMEIGPDDVRWLVTDRGLMRYNPATGEWTTFTTADHPIIEDIWSMLAASDGTLWLGGEDELVQYDHDRDTWSTPVAAGSAPYSVDDIAEASDGSLWVAADGELGHLADGRWSYSAWPSDDWLEKLAIGPDGSIWAGCEGFGRYDPDSGQWQMFGADDGLVHLTIQAIHVTPEGVVWIGTSGGISRYVPEQ